MIIHKFNSLYYYKESSASVKKKRQPASNTLFQIHWNRVVLDEAHTIRNPKTAMSVGCCELSSGMFHIECSQDIFVIFSISLGYDWYTNTE